jgi:hypothetical protein
MKKVIVVLIACLAFVSCKKEEVTPVNEAEMNCYCNKIPCEVSYWAVGGLQVRTLNTQHTLIKYAYDKDFSNNVNYLKSSSTEGDSLWMSLKIDNKFHQVGRKIKPTDFDKRIGFNYHALK